MTISHKEMWIEEHERLTTEYMDAHPGCDEATAMDETANDATDAAADRYAAMCDHARDVAKERKWDDEHKNY